MTNEITISNELTTIVMPRTKNILPGGEHLTKSVTMASGKIVEEVIGFRPTLTATWDYVPQEVITSLCALLRTGVIFTVSYPDTVGTVTGKFKISYPAARVFKYRNGNPFWHDVTLAMTAIEVEK